MSWRISGSPANQASRKRLCSTLKQIKTSKQLDKGENTMYISTIHGLVTRDSLTERRENPAKQASSMLREPGCHPSFMRPPSPKPSSQGFLLLGPHTCGTSVVCADQTLTRASQRGHGGLRIEPGGGSKRLQPNGRSRCFKSVQRECDGMAPGSITKARAVLLRYGSALLKHSPRSIKRESK